MLHSHCTVGAVSILYGTSWPIAQCVSRNNCDRSWTSHHHMFSKDPRGPSSKSDKLAWCFFFLFKHASSPNLFSVDFQTKTLRSEGCEAVRGCHQRCPAVSPKSR
ncbi:hypothetical protein K402DRAFT_21987 [Aulographum hederae CBS 113979]|uniref:Uncharacterized protein n=1 Tax=Aulographum hederae CBS 113979 TaxID=1176131 RepID=A0A6G1H744_9PEZI|nr:hypothetical protein K402DRAFT_21987 [Aulographum hederae CBS 113979]